MKILVITTGGTIGSGESSKGICLEKSSAVVDIYLEKFDFDGEIYTVNPFSVLSENITIENWNTLIDEIQKGINSNYDGIIITHGSDTLSYTSAMVTSYFKNTDKTLCITGANKVLTDEKSNGLSNFIKCVDLIKEGRKGVFAVFDDIFPGDRILEADIFTDKFSLCPFENDLIYDAGKTRYIEKVLMIKCYPFMDFDAYSTEKFSAVLLCAYHSGTIPSGDISFKKFINRCKKENKEVYIAFAKKDSTLYESTLLAEKLGAKILYNTSPENAFAYLMFKVNANRK